MSTGGGGLNQGLMLELESAGPGKPWGYSLDNVGGYGVASSGQQHLTVPVLQYAGKGPSVALALAFDSVVTNTNSGAQPPISSGWSHSYHARLAGVGTGTVAVCLGDGSRTPFTQNLDGSFTAPAGVHDTLVANAGGTHTLTRKDGSVLSFGTNNRLATMADRNGNALTLAYGTNGELATVTDASGRVLSFGYDGSDRLTTITDPASRTFSLSYDGNHHLSRVTYPSPGTGYSQPYFEFTSDATRGTVTGFRDRRGNTWTLTYDVTEPTMIVSVTDPASQTLTMNWVEHQITREDGTAITWTTNTTGDRLSTTLAADGYHSAQTESFTWDSDHNKLSHTTPRGKTWTYTYDSRGNRLTTVDPDFNTVGVLTYNSLDLPVTVQDALSHESTYGYDSNGNLTSVTDPASGVTTYEYSAAGLLTRQTDAKGHETYYGYDTYGNLTSLTDPRGKVTSWTYNSLSLKTSRTDALGRTTGYTYDTLGRLTGTDYPTGTDSSFSYDANDALLSCSDGTGTTTRAYNNLGRMTSETKAGRTLSYGYDSVGNRTSLMDPDGRVFGYGYDNAGRMVAVTLNGSAHAAYGYDADGNLTSQTNPNGTTVTQTFDNAGRLATLQNKDGSGATLSSFSYTCNANGQRTGVTEADGTTVSWGYDSLNRLTSEVRTGTHSFTASYVLDPVGNWSSRTVGGTTTSFTYDASDRLTAAGSTTYSWNDTGTLASKTAGGTTTSFTWDYEGQLAAISGGTTFAYDALGRRTARSAGGTTTTFLYDGSRVLLEKQGSTTSCSYTYGNTLLTRGGEVMGYDGHGTLRTVTNASGAVTATGDWESYGQAAGGTGSSATAYAFGATSGYRSDGDAGMMHIGARWYDPQVGRWISADTYLGQTTSPLQRNRYMYCQADPVNAVDPSGHDPWWKIIVGGIVAFVGMAIIAATSVGIVVIGGAVIAFIGLGILIWAAVDVWNGK